MSPEKILYRGANINDIPFMKEMLIECCLASDVTSITVDNLHEYPDTEINIEGWDCEAEPGIIAETESGEPVGAVWLRNLPELGHSVDEYLPEIAVAVSSAYRQKGIAGRLMNELYRKCFEKGIRRISLGVHSGNLPAINLYKKQGWKQDGIFNEYTMMSRQIGTNLHIELDVTHPANAWLEKQADKIGAKGHFGTHIDCYTSLPRQDEYYLPVYLLDCQRGMPAMEEASALPPLNNKALILYTGNMYRNDYGSRAYFDETDTSIQEEVLLRILDKSPQLILIDSYGIGKHGNHHIGLDKTCEAFGCYVVENIRITPQEIAKIKAIRVKFALDYPSTGKPCTVTY